MEENNKQKEIKPPVKKIRSAFVETYADDMAKVIENDPEGGMVRKIIQGEEEHDAERKNLSPESKKNRFFMIAGVLLIGIATLIS